MINQQDRIDLMNYRIQQAKDTTELAVFLIGSNKLTLAVNRIYYGMYYALSALALKHKFETSKHAQLIGWFNKEFVATNTVDKRYGKILRKAFEDRTKGDYDAFVNFSLAVVEDKLEDMKQFIAMIEAIL